MYSRQVILTVASAFVLLVSLSYSQTQASCSFKFFQTPGTINGVNDYATTVGEAALPRAFIRYSNGGFLTSLLRMPRQPLSRPATTAA